MPLSPEQLDNWFTYHAPTEETVPKYRAIRAAQEHADVLSVAILNGGTLATYDVVNARCRRFAEVIDANAPDSADKSAAIRCVRLARNALNEAIAVSTGPGVMEHPPAEAVDLCRIAEQQLRMARWQANSAIACGGK